MNREIEARLKISAIDKTGRVLQGVGAKLSDVSRKAEAFNRRQGAIAKGAEAAYGAVARFAAPAVLAYGAVSAVKDFAALERQMQRIGITADASGEETAKAFEKAQQIAKDFRYDSVQPAIEALDTLTASGMSLSEAMAFLPSVMATAQASGAATSDIANTALKAADSLKIETAEMQKAFDIMVMGGKAGQFELKDMASFIPSLASSFASLGYSGQDGLKQLVALLQTLRTNTGTAGEAATQAANIFGKIYSEETAKKFSNFGIDLRKEMEAAKKSGEDTLGAFIRLSQEAVNGDMSKLPLLFSDQEFRLGMQTLMQAPEKMQEFMKIMNSSQVDGTVFRDLNRIMGDTQSSIDSLSNSWGRLMTSLGSAVATNGGVELMNAVTNSLDYHTAVNRGLEKNGVNGFMARTGFGLTSSQLEKDRMAIAGGYSDPAFIADYNQRLYESGTVKTSTGRQSVGRQPVAPAPEPVPVPVIGSMGQLPFSVRDMRPSAESRATFRNAMRIDRGGVAPYNAATAEEVKNTIAGPVAESAKVAGEAVADGGKQAGSHIEESAAFIRVAGYDVSTAIAAAAEKLLGAAKAINGLPTVSGGGSAPRSVNADTGRSMPPSTFGPR